jgi:hypothetical protein
MTGTNAALTAQHRRIRRLQSDPRDFSRSTIQNPKHMDSRIKIRIGSNHHHNKQTSQVFNATNNGFQQPANRGFAAPLPQLQQTQQAFTQEFSANSIVDETRSSRHMPTIPHQRRRPPPPKSLQLFDLWSQADWYAFGLRCYGSAERGLVLLTGVWFSGRGLVPRRGGFWFVRDLVGRDLGSVGIIIWPKPSTTLLPRSSRPPLPPSPPPPHYRGTAARCEMAEEIQRNYL